jgi:hypothetical protein
MDSRKPRVVEARGRGKNMKNNYAPHKMAVAGEKKSNKNASVHDNKPSKGKYIVVDIEIRHHQLEKQ